MASSDSTAELSDVLVTLSETMANFRSESQAVESEFIELVAGLGELGPVTVCETVASEEPPAFDSTAVERLENLDRSIADQRLDFVERQDKLSDDVGHLRVIVDRQAQLFAAWLKSATKLTKDNSSDQNDRKNSSEDEVLSDVSAQFKELIGAASSGGEVSTV